MMTRFEMAVVAGLGCVYVALAFAGGLLLAVYA